MPTHRAAQPPSLLPVLVPHEAWPCGRAGWGHPLPPYDRTCTSTASPTAKMWGSLVRLPGAAQQQHSSRRWHQRRARASPTTQPADSCPGRPAARAPPCRGAPPHMCASTLMPPRGPSSNPAAFARATSGRTPMTCGGRTHACWGAGGAMRCAARAACSTAHAPQRLSAATARASPATPPPCCASALEPTSMTRSALWALPPCVFTIRPLPPGPCSKPAAAGAGAARSAREPHSRRQLRQLSANTTTGAPHQPIPPATPSPRCSATPLERRWVCSGSIISRSNGGMTWVAKRASAEAAVRPGQGQGNAKRNGMAGVSLAARNRGRGCARRGRKGAAAPPAAASR